MGYEVAMGLVDIETFYDNVQLHLLFTKAIGRTYPVRFLALAHAVRCDRCNRGDSEATGMHDLASKSM